jgi:hypothetical protein
MLLICCDSFYVAIEKVMDRRTLGLCIMILVWAVPVYAQSKIDEHGVRYPSEEELAASKRLGELLRHPTFVTLRLVSSPRDFSHGSSSDAPSPYTVGDWISFQLFVTQSLSESLWVDDGGLLHYYEYRPELYKDGDLVAFSNIVTERVASSERNPFSISSKPYTMVPDREYESATLNLDDWYDPLGPGHYQLSVRKRFVWDGAWVQSNPVIFDVEPRKPPTPIPAGVSVEMVPEAFQDKPKQKLYRLSSDLYLTVVVVNNSNREVLAPAIDIYYGNRPQLFKDGVLLPYLDEMMKLLNSKEEDSRSVDLSLDLSLPPHTRTGLQGLNLTKWYGPLDPGHYRLINRHRFEIDGPWTADSAELLFEIVR